MLAEQSMLKDYELSLINLLEESEEDSGKQGTFAGIILSSYKNSQNNYYKE